MKGEGMDWKRVQQEAQMRRHGSEEAEPKAKEPARRGGSHVKPGKVRKWADMTQAERDAVTRTIKAIGDEG
jgi:hypothetical protein